VLAVIYDDFFRQYLEDVSSKLGASFKLEDFLQDQNDQVLRRAKAEYDKLFRKSVAGAKRPAEEAAVGASAAPVTKVLVLNARLYVVMLSYEILPGSETEKVLELRRRWSLVQGLPEVAAGKAAEEEAPLTRNGECASSLLLPDMCRCFVCTRKRKAWRQPKARRQKQYRYLKWYWPK